MKTTLIIFISVYLVHSQVNFIQEIPSINFLPPKFPNIPNISIPNVSPSISSNRSFHNDYQCGFSTIETVGQATLSVNPDIALVSVQISGSGKTSNDAITLLSNKISRILNILTNSGLNSSNWKTTSLNIYPNSSYVNNSLITYGQIATQNLQISIPMVESNGSSVGKIYDGLAQIDDININGLTFDLQDKTGSFVAARKLAFEDATKRARDYTNAANVILGAPLTITDSYSSAPSVTTVQSPLLKVAALNAAVPTTVSLGTIDISYNVNIIFSFT